ncbi:MAG: methyltransferase domain-containing protein [Acidobacteria bacterium]|nr:methyltransferase domain-containing protein [Acidobacteriota bacterium]
MSEAEPNSVIAEKLRDLRQQIQRRLEREIPPVPTLHSTSPESLEAAQAAAHNLAAAIGTVNPRPPGLVNGLLQSCKRLLARALEWHVRPQREFNQSVAEALASVSGMLEAAYQDLHALAGAIHQFRSLSVDLHGEIDRLETQLETRLGSLREHFEEQIKLQRVHWEGDLVRQSKELQDRFQGEMRQLEQGVQEQTGKLQAQIGSSIVQIQEELRLLRQRVAARTMVETASIGVAGPGVPKESATAQPPPMDYFQWERHFRGTEEEIRARQSFYIPFFQERQNVLDLACGRGEFLELMRQANVPARGVDLDADMVGRCLQKGLDVVQSDVFQHLESIPENSLDGIFCAQFVEHLEPAAFIRLVSQCAAKLAPGGVLAIETPNPECLAIFSQTFFLDPTHVRPIPPAQMRVVFVEAGLERLATHWLSPASAHLPQLPALDSRVVEAEALNVYNAAVARFNETFLGGMDYAVIGYRPRAISRSTSLARQMQEDWDARARENALFYVANRSEPWTEDEFFETGERDVREYILSDMESICRGRNPAEMRVLEIGCGVGRMTRALARVFGEVHAVDVSGEMIALARQFLRSFHNVYLYQNNGLDLSGIPPLSFDLAFSLLAFQHIPSLPIIEGYVREVGRLLLPGRLFKFQVQGHPVDPAAVNTWVGVSVSLAEAEQMARRCDFDLRRHEGAGTQYFWLWFSKNPAAEN